MSGGIDSMAMLHLVKQLGIEFGIAHCNFQLRGQESDDDAQFVKTSAEILSIPFFLARFETTSYAEENHLSIQMAARDLRYTWFENIRKTNNYDYIATAHNADDSVETFFINLSRGCGLDGLTGIKPKSGNIIRPLLFASREQILGYTRRKGINHREDSSNASDKYLRNYIRHNVVPVLNDAQANFIKGIHTTISNLISNKELFDFFINRSKQELITESNNYVCIDIPKLQAYPQTSALLWEILSVFNFNRDTCFEITGSLDAQPGKIFLSPSHRLIKDRTQLIINKLQKQENIFFYIEPDNIPAGLPFLLKMKIEDCSTDIRLERNASIALLDFNQLEWPLILRKWKPGDYFAPLGMENLKKLSDFLIDQKVSLYDKENTWVLESGNRICWVIGHRIDHRFRIRETTKKLLKLETESLD